MNRILEKEITINEEEVEDHPCKFTPLVLPDLLQKKGAQAVKPSLSGLEFKEDWCYRIERCCLTRSYLYKEWKYQYNKLDPRLT